MASARRRPLFGRLLPLAVCAALAVPTASHALRLVNYNIMLYPSVNVSGRNPWFRKVMQPLGADIVTVQELNSPAGVDSFRTNVLNGIEPGQWSSAPYTNGPDTNNGCFYRPASVTYLGGWSWLPPDNTRLINVYRFRPAGYTNVELRVYSVHLKAGNTSTDESRRLTDATNLRDTLNALPAGVQAIVTGDYNCYRATDPALLKLEESQVNDVGRLYDPLALTGTWQDNASIALYHTQCPSTTAYRPSGSYSGGGIDDRFDLFLPTYDLGDGEGLDLLTATYATVGNDGQHLNKSITDTPLMADTTYARALWWASDHLPIRVDLQVPAKIAVDASPIDVGTAILGASPLPTRDLAIGNPAVAPADELTLTFSTTPGFQPPAATTVVPGASSTNTIRLGTGSVGFKNGTLTIHSDDPDAPTTNVPLSGTVLDHAQASLDSLADVVADTLDFGTHDSGGFEPLLAAVHDRGYGPLRARLAVSVATIDGGDGRFAVAGFAPTLIAGTAGRWSVSFDDAGATPDSDYTATLTFTSADEPLPGAVAQPALAYTLLARVAASTVAVGTSAPAFSRLHPPSPNPASGGTTVRFDLAQAGRARLEVFDLGGRRVAQLADRTFDAGSYRLRWDGRDERGGGAEPGLYFVRLTAPGVRSAARIAVVR